MPFGEISSFAAARLLFYGVPGFSSGSSGGICGISGFSIGPGSVSNFFFSLLISFCSFFEGSVISGLLGMGRGLGCSGFFIGLFFKKAPAGCSSSFLPLPFAEL